MLTQDEPTKIHMSSKKFLQFQETNYADNNSGLYTPYPPRMFNVFLLTKLADSSDFTWLELSLLRQREKP